MEPIALTNPKAFISYSWTTQAHQDWVRELATRLMNDGIEVILDKWDLKEGHDKHAFMEQMVADPTINKVLVVCDSGYQIKADMRTGGVGTESQLISKEVYEDVGQEKFIPLVREYKDGKPCMPHYMGSRMYIDLVTESTYEESYQRLVRNLFGKPELKKPNLGVPPSYVTQDDAPLLKTAHKVTEIKNALINARPSANGLISDYFELFLSTLEGFRLSYTGNEFDQLVVDTIEKMQPLSNDFIDFLFVLFRYKTDVDMDQLTEFFENLLQFQVAPQTVNSWTENQFDNYRFFCYQIMLNTIAALIKMKKFDEAGYFIHNRYFLVDKKRGQTRQTGIEYFNRYVHSLEEDRKRRLNLNLKNVAGFLIRQYSVRTDLTFDDIRLADLIIYYCCQLEQKWLGWFPRTAMYNDYGVEIELFKRMASTRFFEKSKHLFDVSSLSDFKAKLEKYLAVDRNQTRGHDMWYYDVLPLESVLKIDEIGSIN